MAVDGEWGGYVTGTATGSSAGSDDWSFSDDPQDDSWETYCDRSTWSYTDYVTRGPQCVGYNIRKNTIEPFLRVVPQAAEKAWDDTRDDVRTFGWMQVIVALGLIAGAAYVLPSFAGTGFQVGRRR